MGRQQILADLGEFKLDPKKKHYLDKTRLATTKETAETKGVWEQTTPAESSVEEDVAYVRDQMLKTLKVPVEYLTSSDSVVTEVVVEPVEEVTVEPVVEVVSEIVTVQVSVEEPTHTVETDAGTDEDQVTKKKTKKKSTKVT